MGEFRGVVPALITPFNAEGAFDEAAYRQLMEHNILQGVDGFWIAGGTGESVLLSEEEVIQIARVSADQSKRRIKSIVHVGSLTTKSAVRMAKAARDAGVDAISCVPPFFYRPKETEIIEHYRAVADAASLPFFVYNQPKYTGVEITPTLMQTIIEKVPHVAGIKHSAPDFHNIRRFAKMGIDVFTGSGSLFLAGLSAGASGVVDGPLCVAPRLWVDAYKLFKEGDLQGAQALQERGARLIDLAGKYGMQATCKVLTEAWVGVSSGAPRAPLLSLTEDETRHLLGEAAEIISEDPVRT
jgi:N-acetylneuraminate lyase